MTPKENKQPLLAIEELDDDFLKKIQKRGMKTEETIEFVNEVMKKMAYDMTKDPDGDIANTVRELNEAEININKSNMEKSAKIISQVFSKEFYDNLIPYFNLMTELNENLKKLKESFSKEKLDDDSVVIDECNEFGEDIPEDFWDDSIKEIFEDEEFD